MKILVYEDLVREFENTLVTRLRGHNNDAGFLEMWVPDMDPAKSILNMVESAELSGAESFMIRIQQSTLGTSTLDELRNMLREMAEVSVHIDGPAFILEFSEIRKMA